MKEAGSRRWHRIRAQPRFARFALAAVLLGGCGPYSVEVLTTPAGAVVTVNDQRDDEVRGFPQDTVRAEYPGYHAATVQLPRPSLTQWFTRNYGPIRLILSPRHHLVTVTGVPPNAAIDIRPGSDYPIERVGRRAFVLLPTGEHELVVQSPEIRPVHTRVTITGRASVTLKPRPRGSALEYVRTVSTGEQPKSVIFTPDNRFIFVPLLAGKGMDIVNVHTGEISTVEVPEFGSRLGFVEGAFGPREFYLSQMTTSQVHVFGPGERGWGTPEYLRSVHTGSRWPKVIAVSGEAVAVSNWLGQTITVFDPALAERNTVRPGGTTPRGLAFADEGASLLAAFYTSGEIARIDTGGSPRHIVVHPTNGFAYASDMALGVVWVYDLKSDTVKHSIPVWYNANTIDLSPDGSILYVSTRGPNNPRSYRFRSPSRGRIYVIRTSDRAVIEVIEAGNQPTGLDISPDGSMLAFSNFQDDTVEIYRIDPATRSTASAR